MTDQCSTCRFWLVTDTAIGSAPQSSLGYCRRRPPRIVEKAFAVQDMSEDGFASELDWTIRDQFAATNFPVSADDEWCGKWRISEEEASRRRRVDIVHEGAKELLAFATAAADAEAGGASGFDFHFPREGLVLVNARLANRVADIEADIRAEAIRMTDREDVHALIRWTETELPLELTKIGEEEDPW